MAANNDPIPKICMFCQNLFDARKSTTQYCSDKCANRAYKERKRQERNLEAQKQNHEKIAKPIRGLQKRDYISVEEAAIILGVSRWMFQRAIKQVKLESAKLIGRRIISQKSFKKFFKS